MPHRDPSRPPRGLRQDSEHCTFWSLSCDQVLIPKLPVHQQHRAWLQLPRARVSPVRAAGGVWQLWLSELPTSQSAGGADWPASAPDMLGVEKPYPVPITCMSPQPVVQQESHPAGQSGFPSPPVASVNPRSGMSMQANNLLLPGQTSKSIFRIYMVNHVYTKTMYLNMITTFEIFLFFFSFFFEKAE